jgi:hypothetical protein
VNGLFLAKGGVVSWFLRWLILGGALWAAVPVTAMEYSRKELGSTSLIVLMYGPIIEGDTNKLAAYLNGLPKKVSIFGFALHSPGGDIDEANKLAQFLRRIHALTIVGDGNICASACFLPFAAGRIKLVHPGSKVVVQGTASPDGLDNLAALAATNKMARYASELGVPGTITRKIVVIPTGRVEFLSRADLLSMGAEFPHDSIK